MKYRLATAGYQGRKPAEFLAVAEAGYLVLDVRLKPWSPAPQWRQPALKSLLGASYAHARGLGNLRYREGPPVELADPEAGFAQLGELLERGPVCLICCCATVATCHRSVVAEEAARRWPGLEVVHLGEEAAP